MKLYSDQALAKILDREIFHQISSVADRLGMECYVVGGYVRDIFLERPSDDIDVVVVGSGIEVAKHVADAIGRKKSHLAVFKTYGTAQVKTQGIELEFVGARRESYNRNSRNPIVEDGTLHDDQCRRDFTINAMAISVNKASWGKLLDPFDGIGDLERQLIRTPLDPDITFSDDPLRMMRAIRFATQLGFEIEQETFKAIRRNAQRLKIITRERMVLILLMDAGTRITSFTLCKCSTMWQLKAIMSGCVGLRCSTTLASLPPSVGMTNRDGHSGITISLARR